jgi:hypothetical protein
VIRCADDATIPAEAVLGLAFNQAIKSGKSLAGIVFLAKRTYEPVTNGENGAKSFKTSYGSEWKTPVWSGTNFATTLRVFEMTQLGA